MKAKSIIAVCEIRVVGLFNNIGDSAHYPRFNLNCKAMANLLMNYLIPEDMQEYLSFYGTHFNKLLCEFAVSKMMREDKQTKVLKPITPIKMDELKAILEKHKVEIDTNEMYDALYLANMVKADYWGSSIEDEEHMARYIEDVICDPDGYDGLVFGRFLADCSGKGVVIFWEQMINSKW